MLLPKQAVLVKVLDDSPLAGKCLSTEQVVASILPDTAPAQTHVLEALCEEGIKPEMLRLQGKLRAERYPLSPAGVFLVLPHPAVLDAKIVVNNIIKVLKITIIDITIIVQTQVVSPGQNKLTDLPTMDHLAREP